MMNFGTMGVSRVIPLVAAILAGAISESAGQDQERGRLVRLPVMSVERTAGKDAPKLLAAIFVEVDRHAPLPPGATLSEEDLRPNVVFMGYDDGTILWADDAVRGGRSFKSAKIDPLALRGLVERYEKKPWFADPYYSQPHRGPDSSYSVTYINGGEKTLFMNSWHELMELNPLVGVMSYGAVGLKGRDRRDMLAQEPTQYIDYRLAWTELKKAILDLVPKDSVTESSAEKIVDVRIITLRSP